jgi:hypothetical protein
MIESQQKGHPMTLRNPSFRSSRLSARRRSRCAVTEVEPAAVVPTDEANVKRLMAAHLGRLAHPRWFAHPQACFGRCAQQLAEVLAAVCTADSWSDGSLPTPLTGPRPLPHLFDPELREIWLVQLWHAFDDAQFPLARRASFWTWVEALSVQLMPPRAVQPTLNRYPYATVQAWFADRPDESGPEA